MIISTQGCDECHTPDVPVILVHRGVDPHRLGRELSIWWCRPCLLTAAAELEELADIQKRLAKARLG